MTGFRWALGVNRDVVQVKLQTKKKLSEGKVSIQNVIQQDQGNHHFHIFLRMQRVRKVFENPQMRDCEDAIKL